MLGVRNMIIRCELCGKEFEASPNRRGNYPRFCPDTHYDNCPICGKQYVVKPHNLGKPPVCCSYECRAKKTAQTSLEKYGCKAPGNNPEARKKASETMMEHLGVPYAMMNKDVREKSKEVLVERYGVENIAKNPEYKMKAVNTSIERYGQLPFNSKESYEKQHRTIFEKYGVNAATSIPHVQLSSHNRISQMNLDFKDKLEKLGYDCKLEYRINNRYFDIYVEKLNSLIELNPTYTHWMYASKESKDYDKYYHRNKSLLAESAGIQCIHIWDWDNHRKVLGNLIQTSEYDASNFSVYKLNEDAANKFLKENDLRGSIKGSALHLGLVKDNEIFQCISFIRSRYSTNFDIELVRLTTKLYNKIIGGFDKLSREASLTLGIDRCICYMDYSKPFNQSALEEMNMKFKYLTPPALVYSKGIQFYSQNLINKKFNTVEDITLENGWLPMYTCGSKVYTFE